MNVSIHQPQYLPWLPYLLKIEESDLFIALDSVDFQKNGLQNRNQIKTAQGPIWLTVPVRQRLGQKILEVEINAVTDWRKKHWNSIVQNYGKATHFRRYADELEEFYSHTWCNLCDLNLALLQLLLGWMEISTPIRRSSSMKSEGKASELVLNLCRESGAQRYLSGVGGAGYLDGESFREAGIDVDYRPPALPDNYPQLFPKVGFMNDLSALDLILNCGSDWRSYLSRGDRGGEKHD